MLHLEVFVCSYAQQWGVQVQAIIGWIVRKNISQVHYKVTILLNYTRYGTSWSYEYRLNKVLQLQASNRLSLVIVYSSSTSHNVLLNCSSLVQQLIKSSRNRDIYQTLVWFKLAMKGFRPGRVSKGTYFGNLVIRGTPATSQGYYMLYTSTTSLD